MPWNNSCANPIWLEYVPTFTSSEVLCNDSSVSTLVTVSGGGGGVSDCAVITAGGCSEGYAQPSWQSQVVGIPNLGLRGIPDISLFAGMNNVLGASGTSWIICTFANVTCDLNGSSGASDGFQLIGGTSASTPAFAGSLALLLQTQASPTNPDGRQGLINPRLYQLASLEYGTSETPNTAMLTGCNSTNGNSVNGNCIFYDITQGSNAQPCLTGSPSCITQTSGDTFGILGLNGVPAFAAGTGYDLATGLGSLNVANFVAAWMPPSIAITSGTPQSVFVGAPIAPVSLVVTGAAPLAVTASSSALSSVSISAGCGVTTFTCTVNAVAPSFIGATAFTLTATDRFDQSASSTISVTVTIPPPPTIAVTSGGTQSVTAGSAISPVVVTLTGAIPLSLMASDNALSSIVVSPGCGSTTLVCSVSLGSAPTATGGSTLSLNVVDRLRSDCKRVDHIDRHQAGTSDYFH